MPQTAIPAGAVGLPDVMTRHDAEEIIEWLIAQLDYLDGDPDIEDSPHADSDTEPSLGWIGRPDGRNVKGCVSDLELDESDAEPWLGTTVDEDGTGPVLQAPFSVDDREIDLAIA